MTGGIELGGTKIVVAVGEEDGTLVEQHRFPTTGPDETLSTAAEWLSARGPLSSLGIAAFGPVVVDQEAPNFGEVLSTPKPGWSGVNIVDSLLERLGEMPVSLETDVNVAALIEVSDGAAKGLDNAAYITIGTGIGAGLVVNGRLANGGLHPEFGHLRVPRHPEDDFEGVCPYHGDCLEGLASGPAIAKRWGVSAHELPADHKAWDMEAWYLAHGVLALLAIISPQRVVIGGGVSQVTGTHAKVEAKLAELSAGYFSVFETHRPYVVPPSHEQNAGIQGALNLASDLLK